MPRNLPKRCVLPDAEPTLDAFVPEQPLTPFERKYFGIRSRVVALSCGCLRRDQGTTWSIVSAIGALLVTASGFDTVCRSPLCAMALPDFEMRAPMITCGNCDNFMFGSMPMPSVSTTVAGS